MLIFGITSLTCHNIFILQESKSYNMTRISLVLLLYVICHRSTATDNLPNKFKIIDSLIERNQLDSATSCLNEIEMYIKDEKNLLVHLKYFDQCAVIQKEKGNYENVLAYYDSISKILPDIRPKDRLDSMLVARGYFCSGMLFSTQNKFSESIDPYEKALLLSEAEPNNQLRSYYYQNIGFCYLMIGQVDNGIKSVNKAFEIYDANEDYDGKLGCLDYIANTMVDLRNFKLAKQYFDMALSLKDSTNDEYQNLNLFNNIGRMYNYEMKYDSALHYFNFALSESISKKNDLLIAITQCNIGEVLMKQGNFEKAIFTLDQALSKFNLIHLDLGIFQATHLIAFCEYKRNDLKKAELFQTQAEKLLQKTEIQPAMQLDFYKRSYELKKGFGKLKESLAYLEKYQFMQDSINSRLTNWKINEIESRLLTSIKEKQLVQKESELKQHKSIIWIMISLFILAAILTTIIALYIRKRREVEYQKQLSKMAALRMQNARNAMSPHFFFNVLASLNGLTKEPEQFAKKLQSLSLLLRKVIENIDRTAVSLDEELAAVKAFVDLSSHKIPQPFSVEYLIDEGAKLHGLIPAMMIQIPVENAIKHGLMPLEGSKKLTISVTDFNEFRQISVTDNGIGLKASTGRSVGTGTGLKVLMQTIHLLNVKNQSKIKISIKEREPVNGHPSGTAVDIQIPYEFNYTL